MLSKEASSTIFWVFGMTRPGIEPRSPGPLANTLTPRPVNSGQSRPMSNANKGVLYAIQICRMGGLWSDENLVSYLEHLFLMDVTDTDSVFHVLPTSLYVFRCSKRRSCKGWQICRDCDQTTAWLRVFIDLCVSKYSAKER